MVWLENNSDKTRNALPQVCVQIRSVWQGRLNTLRLIFCGKQLLGNFGAFCLPQCSLQSQKQRNDAEILCSRIKPVLLLASFQFMMYPSEMSSVQIGYPKFSLIKKYPCVIEMGCFFRRDSVMGLSGLAISLGFQPRFPCRESLRTTYYVRLVFCGVANICYEKIYDKMRHDHMRHDRCGTTNAAQLKQKATSLNLRHLEKFLQRLALYLINFNLSGCKHMA